MNIRVESSLIIDLSGIMNSPGHPGFFVCGMMSRFGNASFYIKWNVSILYSD